MLKLYKYKGLVFQFEEGHQPEGAELLKPGEPYKVEQAAPEPEPEPKAKPAKNKAKKPANKKG